MTCLVRHALVVVLSLAACGDSGSAPGDGGSDASATAGSDGAPATSDGASSASDGSAAPSDGPSLARSDADFALVSDRPYHFKVPSAYDKTKPTPLVILLHGYGADGPTQDAYFGLSTLADQRTFLYAYPDGTIDPSGKRFWNATDACCDLYGLLPDDVAYVNAIIDDVAARYNVDGKRIFLVGHSNGGFMSHRFSCDGAPRIAAIVSLAGAQWMDQTRCKPQDRVSVLEVHGDSDAVIAYGGGSIGTNGYPSAHQTVADWAQHNGCTGALAATGMTLDLDSALAGNETRVEAYGGCPQGGHVELWTIQGGSHVPSLQPTWAATIYGFLAAHPKP